MTTPEQNTVAREKTRKGARAGGARGGREVHLQGIAVSPGIAVGRVHLLAGGEVEFETRRVAPEAVAAEAKRFLDAVEAVRSDLRVLRKAAVGQVGEELARILDAHLLILEDDSVIAQTRKRIADGGVNAESAFHDVVNGAIGALLARESEYLRDRAGDLRDVRRRVLRRLAGTGASRVANLKANSVVVARELSPSETMALPKKKVAAFLSDAGGKTSHAAILARSLGIPAVVGLEGATEVLRDQELVIVDGMRGTVVCRPTEKTLRKYKEEEKAYERLESSLTSLADQPAVTQDHHAFELSVNIDLPNEVDLAIAKGARGIGLYRTEFLFLAKGGVPSEEEQYNVYETAAEKVAPDKVIFRTLDLGGDKVFPNEYVKEKNPFLGLRGIRLSLRERAHFRAQLRAILRASARRNVRVMFPMVSTLEELAEARAVCREAQRELTEEGIPFDEGIELGIMVETPAAAVLAESFAREVDFFSIGTNDLIQYTLAVDRGNERLAALYEPFQPAVLRTIHAVVDSAHKARIWVGVCGEMASDPLALLFLIGLGVDEISTTPFMVPQLKSVVRSVKYEDLRLLSRALLKMQTGREARAHVRDYVEKNLRHLKIYL
jgi:phosphotransferase system enzyme I (PtsI)